MTRDEIVTQLELINDPDNAVEIYILGQPELNDGNLEIDCFKTRMHESLPSEILELFYPKIKKKIIDKDFDPMEYDPSITPDRNVIWTLNSEPVFLYNTITSKINGEENIPIYKHAELSYSDIWAYWIKVYKGDDSFFIIKKVVPSKVIKTGGALAMIYKDDIFRSFEDDILTIDGAFDAISINGQLVFENKPNFEKALLYDEVKRVVAKTALDEIEETNLVEDFDRVKDFLKDDFHSINKLNKIKEKPYFKKLTFNKCKQIINDYGVDIEMDNANSKFKISNKQQAKLFIKVLNDDFLMSEMTELKYAANSKEGVDNN